MENLQQAPIHVPATRMRRRCRDNSLAGMWQGLEILIPSGTPFYFGTQCDQPSRTLLKVALLSAILQVFRLALKSFRKFSPKRLGKWNFNHCSLIWVTQVFKGIDQVLTESCFKVKRWPLCLNSANSAEYYDHSRTLVFYPTSYFFHSNNLAASNYSPNGKGMTLLFSSTVRLSPKAVDTLSAASTQSFQLLR